MSKKTNEKTVDLLYLNNNDNIKKQKRKKNNNLPKKTVKKDDVINLDNEIIIGLTPKPEKKEPKKNNKKQSQIKKQKNTSNTQKKQNNKQNVKQPKQNKIKLKILKWTSLAIILEGIVILFLLSPLFNVKQIIVEGTEKVVNEEVISLSQIKINENTFKIRTSETIQRIQENTYVETATIIRELPSTIKIVITERKPQYIIQIANGNVYIDSNGYILEISTEALQLPILNGYVTPIDSIIDFNNTKKLLDEDCEKIHTISKILEAARNNNVLTYITAIDMSDTNDIKLNLDTERKIAHLGDGSNANMRILYLKRIIEGETGKEGEIFIDGDLSTKEPKPKPYFREKV